MITIFCKLIAKEENPLGYVTYVFESEDASQQEILKTKYLMCVRFPNWDHRNINLGEEGYLNYKIVREGLDTWFDGSKFIPYRYTNIQFLKFLSKPKEINETILTD